MNRTHSPLADEASIYPYTAWSAVPARSLLVLAPHPDDEVFGCGGITALALDAGASVNVVVVTDGGRGGDVAVREAESQQAALALAGAAAPATLAFWREGDRELRASEQLVLRLRACMAETRPDWVLVPSPNEIHPDHRTLCVAACAAFTRSFGAGSAARLVFYEVGQPLFPNTLVDITPVLARKRAAMNCFASQLQQQRYDEHVLALNRYRSYTLGAQVTHAEALQIMRAEDLADGLGALVARAGQEVVQRLGLTG